jgi:hypothetical protein
MIAAAALRFACMAGVSIAAAVLAAPARAQDAILESSEAEPAKSWGWFANLWTGYDHVSGLPNDRPDFGRVRGRMRAGAFWNFAPQWDFVGAARLARGSDSNRDNRRNNDNERSDSVGLDQLLLRWHPGENTTVALGKAPLPLELSPMVWDSDLRPAGLALDHSVPIREFDRLQIVAGYFAGQHLYGDESRIGAVQLAWRWHEGAPLRGSALLSYLTFDNLGELTRQGLARTNSIVAGRLVNDYRLLDLQLAGHLEAAGRPVDARLDVVDNLGADDAKRGIRASLSVGERTRPREWEFGYAFQRIQKDAVIAAFNSDDWWFHSAERGHLAWIGYGIAATWSLRLAGFHERRDGLREYTDRVRLDLEARW